ncbi:hypothetical protein J7376_19395 [Paracoccus sp. R12_1]|uniref:hypothetical protein n=1 Tax=unclassified Paracoccus (in: a-proteobacteria) TaxID=2688777 RepID=UPI001ADADD87|nr:MULTISPECIES: hypothetical protein [unclassified Paracoccus (in: a-proteobacteria)]MBO9457398.1 hypothetical protein [Paracoccus sp. R12_2]MBO9488675.1 hypothetical protein [Paracoccus sp. R12_1]
MSELQFCGRNRQRDLTRLIRAYDDVAAAAEGTKAGTQVREPVHRVVLIHAERGLGKTRLAMELYRHLTTSRDPEHYWPDDYGRLAERVAVMPAGETCNYASDPRFVWWGLAIADGPNPGNTVFNGLEDLLPHLTAAQLSARRRASGRDMLHEFADLAADAGIEIADASLDVLGQAIGLGMFKRIGQAAWKVGSIVSKHTSDGDAPLDASGKRINTVVDGVMSDLSRLFAPSSSMFAGMPLVVLIDDAQFADRDRTTAVFVERLIAASAAEGWPLLLLVTHWSRQLRRWRDGRDAEQPRSAVSEVLNHARNQTPEEPGPFNGSGGGTLADERFIEIDLGEPVDNLAPALRGQFPGLMDETVASIVEKSGGNPRKLEQIAARMHSRPIWFEDLDRTRDLTAAGRESVLSLADLRIDDIVLERFHDTTPAVRRALLLASVMGSRFVVDFVDRMAAARFGGHARSDLEEGESRYRFVRDVLDRSRNDIAAFSERLFVEAAEAYLKHGMARAHLKDWPEASDLYAVLDDLLNDIIDDPTVFHTLTDDDRALALALAADRMLLAGSHRAGLALAHLVRTENARGNPEGAYEAAHRFIAGFAS